MIARKFAPVLALSALAALPACSMFGGGNDRSSNTSQYTQPAPSAYSGNTTAGNAIANTPDQSVAPVSPAVIRKVQTALKQDNDYSGRVDGVWGPRTQSGLRKWQSAHNINASGVIDMPTMQAMNIQSDNSQNASTNDNQNNQATNDNTQPNNPNYTNANNHPNNGNYTAGNNNNNNNTPYPTNGAPATTNGTTGNGGGTGTGNGAGGNR